MSRRTLRDRMVAAGKASGLKRKGDSVWARMMAGKRGAKAMRRTWPIQSKAWSAAGCAVANGLPMPALPVVDVSPEVVERREARHLAKRRAAYDKEHAND